MTESSHQKKMFTVEQANAMLPLVRAIASDLAALYNDVVERRQRLDQLPAGRDLDSADLYSDELIHMKDEIRRDEEKLTSYASELHDLGVDPKSAAAGLVDFPTLVDGRPAYLCWKLGESEVCHWHDLDAGFSGRQRLTAGTAIGGGDDSLNA